MKSACKFLFTLPFTALLFLLAHPVLGHGLMEDPPSRNWLCGAITKPDQVANGTAAYPICGDAFAVDFNGGYSFMSVLTHDVGRSGVTPLPEHVCGFGSETWNGGATPWDTPIDWPTNAMSAGRNEITWNISWGPHFDDTEEFRYWITKSDFQFQVGVPLTWQDFEDQPFCVLNYVDTDPTGNPDVVPDKAGTRFHTFCDVPARSGRHVIYGEWGRNFFTFERFHGCIDAVFDGSQP
ncbi:MAG: lytic polysaccharide monooxygenase auxiliary activity family 9 protein, partial [Acidobacteriota bacterium]